ncbi:MAG: hypothetical protein IPK82_04085 [Polyangiaceae bacterium]|nr:hypothetical protein [Polyangiaceae bacterium]
MAFLRESPLHKPVVRLHMGRSRSCPRLAGHGMLQIQVLGNAAPVDEAHLGKRRASKNAPI